MNVFEFSNNLFTSLHSNLNCSSASYLLLQFKFSSSLGKSFLIQFWMALVFLLWPLFVFFAKAFVLVTLLTLITVLHSYHIVLQGCVNDFHYWCYKTIKECWSHSCPLVVLQPSDIALVSHKLYKQCVLWLMSVILADRWAVQNGREAPVNSLSEHQQWRTLSD